MSKPKVSVCMPLYNTEEAYLREAVSGILNQSFSDFEFLIVNDSPQNTKLDAIIGSFDDKRIKYSVNAENLGIARSRNLLLDKAEGEYIAIMDHDDISLPERLAKQVDFLDCHQDIGVVGCCYQRIPDGKIKKMPITDIDIKYSLFTRCALLHPSAMIRKSILAENQIRYNQEYTPAEDYALWCSLVPFTRFANLPDILFRYRQHSGNTSKIQRNKMKESTQNIASLYKENNKALWTAARKNIVTVYRLKLFSFLTLISAKEYHNRRTYNLLGFIPLFWRSKTSQDKPFSFLSSLPGCKISVKMRYLKK